MFENRRLHLLNWWAGASVRPLAGLVRLFIASANNCTNCTCICLFCIAIVQIASVPDFASDANRLFLCARLRGWHNRLLPAPWMPSRLPLHLGQRMVNYLLYEILIPCFHAATYVNSQPSCIPLKHNWSALPFRKAMKMIHWVPTKTRI